jgi:hypothetical protein
VSGDIYWMRIAPPGGETIHVLNLDTQWDVDPATWAALMASGGQPISLAIVRGRLNQNRLIEGPYRVMDPRTFTVQ